MKPVLGVPEARLDEIAAFVKTQDIPVEVVVGGECDIQIVEADERKECDASSLYAGGWITCVAALGMAARLDSSPQKLGMLLNFLNIKVRRCSLGLFK